jgi:peptidoglycan-associated lipoprotein
MFKKVVISALVLGLAMAAGCAGSSKKRGSGKRTGSDSGGQTMPADGGVDQSVEDREREGTGTPQGISRSVVYFDYDAADVKAGEEAVVGEHAAYLAKNSSVRVRLEGHCDERGSREYNIGLGERRSQAVQQMLLAKGVSQDQITVTSFGEERPASLGHDESAWTQNRRVEFIYP